MSQIGIVPYMPPYPHDHSSIAQGGAVPLTSITGHSAAVHNALALNLGNLTFDNGCKVYRDGAQIIGTGAWVKILFDTEVYDIGGNFAANDFVAPADGYYLLIACCAFMSLPVGVEHGLVIRVAGADVAKDYRELGMFETESGLLCATIEYMTATQIANAYCYHNRGADNTIFGTVSQTYFCAVKIGG